MHPVQVPERSVMKRRHLRGLHGKRPTQEFVPFGEKVLAMTIHHGAEEQDEPQISVRSMAWNEKQQRRMFHRECRWCS